MDSHEQFTRLWTQAQPVLARYLNAAVPDFQEDLLQDMAVTCATRAFTLIELLVVLAILAIRRTHGNAPSATGPMLINSSNTSWLSQQCMELCWRHRASAGIAGRAASPICPGTPAAPDMAPPGFFSSGNTQNLGGKCSCQASNWRYASE